METAFVSLICIALMVVGGMTMSNGFLTSIDNASNNIEAISQRDEAIMRSNITILTTNQTSADTLVVSLRNNGQTKLGSYDRWDIIVHYHDDAALDHIAWIPYTAGSPGNNQWTVQGIYMDSGSLTPEAFEPGLLNPDEEMVIRCKVSPDVGPGTINLVSVSTQNGVTTSKTFSGYTP
jgi:hypothetical protein